MKAAFIVLFALVAVACAAPNKPHFKDARSTKAPTGICAMCIQAITMVENMADQDEDAIVKAVEDEVCTLFPSFESMCDMFIQMAIKEAIQYLEKGMTPKQICGEFDLC
uniref:Saposin B-type domain-containing protein n=1 Tax=Plectus sambesii TaxID=2011161 RepID=A0A914VS39_9BILA